MTGAARAVGLFRLVLHVATALCFALAALLLAVDAREYPGFSAAAVRAFARGVFPLLLIAAVNLRAQDAGRPWRLAAFGADLVLLIVAVRMLSPTSPVFFWLLAAVATLLATGSAGLLWTADREG